MQYCRRKKSAHPPKKWAAVGSGGKRKPLGVKTMSLVPEILEENNRKLHQKYMAIEAAECRYEAYRLEGAELVFVAYGSTSRNVKDSIQILATSGIKTGLIRPKTLWPFPAQPFDDLGSACMNIVCVEMNLGQMVEDVRLAVKDRYPVFFYGRSGGMIPSPAEIADHAKSLLKRG